uniref:Uncharacterized protein n=1 Tax=viral metagenome TaxID=1070528 RepID=A0A6C0BVF5_9ZZZZ
MASVFVISAVISIIYFIIRFVEMRFVEKENKPLKFLVRDSLLVYFSVVCGTFIIDQLKPVIQDVGDKIAPAVFTDNPGF